MLHSHIQDEEIIGRYVQGELAPENRQAFEDHFFGCEECFQKVQDMERFRAGVLDASRRGLLDERPGDSRVPWLQWAFATTACATLVLAAALGWALLKELPSLRTQLSQMSSQLEYERQANTQAVQSPVSADPEANVPLIMLESSRANEHASHVAIPPNAKRLMLWVEIGSSRYRDFRMEIHAADGRVVTSLDHLQRGPYGALAASIPIEQLPSGTFRIIVTGQNPPSAALVGEYQIRIERH